MGKSLKLLILFLFFVILGPWARATEVSKIHTDIYRKLVPGIAGPDKVLPSFEVCLKHPSSGQCLTDRPRFFSCDDPDIKQYLKCISDPDLSKKISAAYEKMHEAAKADIQRITQNTKMNPAEKKLLMDKLEASIVKFENELSSENVRLKQIEEELKKSNRFEVARLLESADFLQKLDKTCQTHPEACLSVTQYRAHGKKVIEKFVQDFDQLDARLKKEQGHGLDEMLEAEMSLIKQCEGENKSGNSSEFCKSFSPDPVILKAVSDEIKKGLCNHQRDLSHLNKKNRSRMSLICNQYYHYFLSGARPKGQEKNQKASEKEKGSGGWEGGEAGGKNTNRTGIYSDNFSGHLKEELYKCDEFKSELNEDCDLPGTSAVDEKLMDLVVETQKAGMACSQEVGPQHKAKLDAASYLMETQFRAYVDRLNVDHSLTPERYRQELEAIVASCEGKPKQKSSDCDYEGMIQNEARSYLKGLAAQAVIHREKIGFDKNLGEDYLGDTLKAALDLTEIDNSIKDLLGNFPAEDKESQGFLKQLNLCQPIMDDVKNIWKATHYNSRCAPLEVAENEVLWRDEEKFYQEYKAVELGLLPGKTLKDYPPKRVAHYHEMKKTRGFENDLELKSSLLDDPKSSSLFTGRASKTGRVLIMPGTLTGLEGRRLECKKKAQQVKQLINMRLSLIANYPVLRRESGGVPFYRQLGLDNEKNREKINKQLTVDSARGELDSLKKITQAICKDPLAAGEEVIKDDKLYTLYATCALENVQNGERRLPGDLDSYQFWKPINLSEASKARCEKRAREGNNRCALLNQLNSGVLNTLGSSAQGLLPALTTGMNFAGCAAMATGVAGAVHSGLRAGLKAGVSAGLKSGGEQLGRNILMGAKSMASPVGAGLTLAGGALAVYNAKGSEDAYLKLKSRQLSGLATEDEVEAARMAYEEAQVASNLGMLLAGALIPTGKVKHLSQPKKSLTHFNKRYGIESAKEVEALGLPTSANNRAYLSLNRSPNKKVVVFNSEMTVLKDGNDILGRETMTASENLYQEVFMDVLKHDEKTSLLWKSISRTDNGVLQTVSVPVHNQSRDSIIQLLQEKARPPSKLSVTQEHLLTKLKSSSSTATLTSHEAALLYRMFPGEMQEVVTQISKTKALQFKQMLDDVAKTHPLNETERNLFSKLTHSGDITLSAGEIALLDGMSTRMYSGFKSMEGAIDWETYKLNLAQSMDRHPAGLDERTVADTLKRDLAALDKETKERFSLRMKELGLDLTNAKGKMSGNRIQRPQEWKAMGVSRIPPDAKGPSIDEAAMAVRAARVKGSEGLAIYDESIAETVVSQVLKVEGSSSSPGLRQQFQNSLSTRGISKEKLIARGFYTPIPDDFLTLQGYKGPRPQYVISEKIWTVVRKSNGADSIAERLNSLFPELKLAQTEAKLLRDHYEALDTISPAIHSEARGTLPVNLGLRAGGVLDVQGLGALNTQWNDTASHIASLKGSTNDATSIIALSRDAERLGSTVAYQKRVSAMVETVKEELGAGWVVRVSGDDIIFYPDRRVLPDRRKLNLSGGRRTTSGTDPPEMDKEFRSDITQEQINGLVLGLDKLAKKGLNNIDFGGSSLSRSTFVRGEGAQEGHVTLLENLEKNVRKNLEKNVGSGAIELDTLSNTVIGFDAHVPKKGKAIIRVVVPEGSPVTSEMLSNHLAGERLELVKVLGDDYQVVVDRVGGK